MKNSLEGFRLILTPRRAAVVAGFDNQLDVLLRFQAPEAPREVLRERPPYGIALVIDRSGSMKGRPIEEAKRCAAYVASSLRPDDIVSLVQFDNRIEVLCPSAPKGDGNEIRRAISSIRAGGNTNLCGGWLVGVDSLADIATTTGLKRVVLLSDGCANAGITDTAEITAQCADLASRGITTSTYGLGNGFNEDLMVAMATSGEGNHYYGDTADDLMEPFQAEFELLANLCMKNLRLTVEGMYSVELLNDWKCDPASGWKMPDVAWNSEAWAVLRVTLPKSSLPKEGGMADCLRVVVTGTDLDGKLQEFVSDVLHLPVVNSAAYGAIIEDELVVRRLAEIEAGSYLLRARKAAMDNDWSAVDMLLEEAEKRFVGNLWVVSVVETIREVAHGRERERFMKEALYSHASFSKRLSAKDEVPDIAGEALSTPLFLSRKSSSGKAQRPKR